MNWSDFSKNDYRTKKLTTDYVGKINIVTDSVTINTNVGTKVFSFSPKLSGSLRVDVSSDTNFSGTMYVFENGTLIKSVPLSTSGMNVFANIDVTAFSEYTIKFKLNIYPRTLHGSITGYIGDDPSTYININ